MGFPSPSWESPFCIMENNWLSALVNLKRGLFLLLFLPVIGFSQPGDQLYLSDMEPITPEMPTGSFDLNGDSIPELTFSHYVVGTEDVPSSSGTWTIVVQAEAHCEILFDNRTGSGLGESVRWLQPQDTIPRHTSSRKIWQKSGIVELMYMGYGGSATDGWVRVYQEVSDRIAVRFTQGDETWMGWIQWRVEPSMGKVSISEGEVWVVY